jgi:hypothetical protein
MIQFKNYLIPSAKLMYTKENKIKIQPLLTLLPTKLFPR